MKKLVWGVITVLIGAVIFIAIGLGFNNQQYVSPNGTQVARSLGAVTVNGQTIPHVQLTFQTYPDSSGQVSQAAMISSGPLKSTAVHPGGNPSWPAYGPTNDFQVPAHALVTVTWYQYDSGGAVNNPFFAAVHGTIGNVEVVNGKVVRGVDANNMAHTFTVRGLPGVDPRFFVSVPSPVSSLGNNATNSQGGQVVKFSFISGSKGLYAWNCEFPCGLSVGGFGAVMSSFGYMSGYLHVV
jgi:hypothetical protein